MATRDATDKMASRIADAQRKAGMLPNGEKIARDVAKMARDNERERRNDKQRGGER